LLTDIAFDGFTLDEVLKTINERIEILVDRDHTIGHSYFLSVDSGDTRALSLVFQDKIIPLLQEYFYHDYEKLALILGSGFVEENSNSNVAFANFKNIELPSIENQFTLIKKVEDIEKAVLLLLNKETETY
jgi:5-methylcytosine-specific restriction endonuclease McrBC GTP-binding regulatory subunit McrB